MQLSVIPETQFIDEAFMTVVTVAMEELINSIPEFICTKCSKVYKKI